MSLLPNLPMCDMGVQNIEYDHLYKPSFLTRSRQGRRSTLAENADARVDVNSGGKYRVDQTTHLFLPIYGNL